MSKKILIVESDRRLSREMREELEAKGFPVEETADGKKSLDFIRRTQPDLVVLSVELAAGQSGYIICGKLKKDDDLKAIPVVMIGNPDGFVQHSKLKTRADEYVPKPVDLQVLVERVSGLIGFPDSAAQPDDSLTMEDVVEGEGEIPAEEIPLDETIHGDPELDMLDAAFDADSSSPSNSPVEEAVEAPPETSTDDDSAAAFAAGEELEQDADRAVEVLGERGNGGAGSSASRRGQQPEALASAQAEMEVRSLRAQLTALQRSLAQAQSEQNDAEERVRELEAQLESRGAELEAVASTSGKGDKEFVALREALNKKEKEILMLSTELRDKESEMVDLRDHEVQLEQQLSEASVELARRDAQIKALGTRNEQMGTDRKKLQEELNSTRNRLQAGESEAEELRARVTELDSALRRAQEDAADLRSQIEALQSAMDAAHREAQQMQTRLSSEADSLRSRVHEMEKLTSKQEERLTKLFQRIKGHEKVREKTKKALSIALQLLEEHGASDSEDEPAAA